MERECMVLTVAATHGGNVYIASYFIEYGLIQAEIGGCFVVVPRGDAPAEDTVRALLTGHLLQKARKASNARKWTDKGASGAANLEYRGAA